MVGTFHHQIRQQYIWMASKFLQTWQRYFKWLFCLRGDFLKRIEKYFVLDNNLREYWKIKKQDHFSLVSNKGKFRATHSLTAFLIATCILQPLWGVTKHPWPTSPKPPLPIAFAKIIEKSPPWIKLLGTFPNF